MERPMPDELIYRSAQLVKDNGIGLQISCIYGNPGETPEQMFKTLRMVDTIKPILTAPAQTLVTNNVDNLVIRYFVDGVERTITGDEIRSRTTSHSGSVYRVTIRETDDFGNVSAPLVVRYTLDTQPPVIRFETNANAYLTNNLDTFEFRYKADGQNRVLSGQALADSIVDRRPGNGFETVTIRFDAFDAAGNRTVVTHDVKLDTTPPALTIAATVPAQTFTFNSFSTTTFKFVFMVDNTKVTVSGNTAVRYVRSPTPGQVRPGINVLEYWTRDAAGNVATIQVTFTANFNHRPSSSYSYLPPPDEN
jgi:hypothetical protein